ncbi:MAG: nucleoside-diphosphate kinase [Nitrospinae bacterium]|nr:nucleoside-diphosphate kinase [Nitrospinota bacterium]MBF0633202.1 nucleoside-diphosphate kinase [Nitrospinota bacterium]
MSRTFAIIKPDAVERKLTGKIISWMENAGLTVVAMKRLHLTKKQAEGFYAEHSARGFFGDLTSYMSSGPCVVAVLEGENAQPKWRDIMGATNPANAAPGTIRKELAVDLEKNSVHGSDSETSAAREIAYFFSELEVV